MTEPNCLLIRRKGSVSDKIKAYLTDRDPADACHYLFVPKKFVLGPFVKHKGGFKIYEYSVHHYGFEYTDSAKDLEEYQKAISDGAWKVVKSVCVPESELEFIISQTKSHSQACEALKQSKIIARNTESTLKEKINLVIEHF